MRSPLRRGHSEHMSAELGPPTRPIAPQHHAWLASEVVDWRARGLLDADSAASIMALYRIAPTARSGASSRSVLTRILVALGGVFLGIGLIWLVAANLDSLTPMTRFVAVALIWLVLMVTPEFLAARGHSRALVGSLRGAGALAFGAVIFQASQSLQVPAYEPKLLGLWALGALAHAYLVRGVIPLVVAVVSGAVWWLWQPLAESATLPSALLLTMLAALACVGVAGVPAQPGSFARVWRVAGSIAVLAGLFVASLPGAGPDTVELGSWHAVTALIALAAAALALLRGDSLARLEVAGTAVASCIAAGLMAWPTTSEASAVGFADVAHAVVAVSAYVVLAIGVTAVGVLRENGGVTGVAMAGLVAFVTFQSFAVFAPIVTGALLFLVLGAIFIGTGYGFDRARRRLATTLADDRARLTGGNR